MRVVLFAAALFAALASVTPARAPAEDRDVARALEAARARAASGDATAQFSLGAILYYGGTDTAQAIEWIRKAATQQYPPAEFHMGQLYEFGFGVAQNDHEALAWYRKAAEHGDAAAQRSVGDFYQKGRGVPVDAAEAARWYRRGADGDDLRAQYELGNMFFNGTGVPRDYTSAYVWFTIAAGQTPLEDNRQGLLELRNIAAARMTPAAVAEAERRVADFTPGTRRQPF
jgi:TPR repeat protein